MATNRESLSAQSKKRTNYLLLVFGLILALLFLLAWCRMQPKQEKRVIQRSPEDFTITSFNGEEETGASLPNLSSRGDAQLVVTPSEVVMSPNVVIGSDAEAPIILRAENAPILLLGKNLAEQQEEGFLLSGSCMEKDRLNKDEECTLTVSWSPKTLRNIQNTLVIQWREHNPAIFKNERTNVLLKAQSTDSKDCVICCEEKEKAQERPEEVIGLGGEPMNTDTPKDSTGEIRDPETKEIIGITEPDKIPLNLKNELMGNVAKNGDVINKEGKVVGRLLDDNTIIDPKSYQIIGKAVYMRPAMNEHGHLFGKMVVNGDTVSFVDAKGKVVGFPHVDGQVVDTENKPVGFISPWGAVIDFTGKYLGVIVIDGSSLAVVNDSKTKVATMRPMGVAINSKGELIGGVVPRGVGVGAGGRSLGTVSLNGEVKDSFKQTVGHVLLDKAIVDSSMNELGSVVRQGLVIDNTGKPIAFVNSEGKALNFKAEQIGIMNPDGTAFAHKKFIGTLMPEGVVIKGGCSTLGSVYPDGSVVNLSLKTLGHVTPSGKAVDAVNKELGVVVPWGTAIAEGCRLLGLISLRGEVVSTDGVKMGCVNPDNTVQNLQGDLVGEVTPLGLFINEQNQVVGRVRFDGQIMDNKGNILGCVYEKSLQVLGYNTKGVIVDENGYPLGGTSIGNKAYDENGNWIGDVHFNGWVIGDKGQLKGVVPFTGVAFSDSGKVIGYYNQLTGALTDVSGANLGRVLPNLTVINYTGTEILGKVIPEKTPFMRLDGSFLGILRSDGLLIGANVSENLIVHANGSVTDKEGHLVGARIPTGPVLSSEGRYVGLANQRGEVVDKRQIKIGHVLANGLAISDKNQVMGQVFPEVSVGISAKGFVGSVEPKMSGIGNDLAYQLQVNDTRGNLAGTVSGTGSILGMDNAVAGHLVPVAPFVDFQGKLLGWSSFQGEVNSSDGRVMASILSTGSALDTAQDLIGQVIQNNVIVDTMGAYLGHVGVRGTLLSGHGEYIASLGNTRFLYNADGAIVGQVLAPGVAVDLNGQFMGWTRYDGQIENGTKVLGAVGLDGHVFDGNGQMIGRYVAMGTDAFNDDEKSVGFLAESTNFIEASGLTIARMGYEPYVVSKGTIIGREHEGSFVTSLESGRILGMISENGEVSSFTSDKTMGSVKMNQQFINSSSQVEGALVPGGLAIMPTLGLIGSVGQDGQVYKAGKKQAVTTGTGLVYSLSGELIGGVFTPGVLIDKKGSFAGQTSGTSSVFKNGKQIGNKLAFGSALSTSNEWLGNIMPSGGVVNAHAEYYGTIATVDGTVIGKNDVFSGRVLPDGSVAGVPEKTVLNTMPYMGHTIQQGLPVGLNKGFSTLGHSTATGNIVDKSGKKMYNIMDKAYVFNTSTTDPKDLVVAKVLPFISAVNDEGTVLGVLSEDGKILSYQKKISGKVDHEGRVRLNETQDKIDEKRVQGFLVPEDLVVNECKIVGQTAYDGRVINGQGSVVGRIQHDMWAVDANGKRIGKVVENNQPCITEDRQYMGRSLPNSIVVDLNGVEIGCAMNSGEMLGPDGKALCKIVKRGVILDKDGKPIGFLDPTGTVWTGTESIGNVDWNGIAYDWKGNEIGRNTGGETLFYNDNGMVEFTQDSADGIRNPGGELIYTIPPFGPPIGIDNNPIPGLNPYIPGIGYLSGCDLIGYDGTKIASLRADGTFHDDNGDLLYTVTPDGQVFTPNGNLIERFRGLDISTALKQCGMAGASGVSAGRTIKIGNQIFTVDPNGSLVDEEGMIIGYLGDGGRAYTLGNKPITEADIGGRERPDTTPKFKPSPTQIDDFQEKLAQKRKGMKAQMGKGILTISAEMEARAKPKKDKDWKDFGYGRSKENTSSWPVDMTHVILQGKAIPAVLARSIDSRYSNVPVVAIVESNVYAEEGRNVLIPAGSRVIGSFGGGGGEDGISKLQISWNRLIRPDGSAFNLAGAQSGDAQGRGGVAAYLDEQLWNKYGTSLLGTLATSSVAYLMATNDDASSSTADGGTSTTTNKSKAADDARKNFLDQMGTILEDMIGKAVAEPPVVYVPAGTRLTVFPQQDLWLRSVEDDETEANEEFGMPSMEAQLPDVGSWTEKRKNDRDESGPVSPVPQTPDNVKKETETPLYDGTGGMPDISDRKVEPVALQEEPLF